MRFILDSMVAAVGLMFGTSLLKTPDQDWGLIVLVLSAVLLGIVSTRADYLSNNKPVTIAQVHIQCSENECRQRGINYCLGCGRYFCDSHTDSSPAGWCCWCVTRPDLQGVSNAD